ncbi:MAG: hypothetical protein MUO68_12280 [Desulfobacteraceae bacterium]|nr:hypothetical protein [Desulfobacteraceae bacterium]
MIFRTTQKLAKKIDAYLNEDIEPAANPYIDWHANLFRVERYQYILLMHTASLLPIIFPGRGITHQATFIRDALCAINDLFVSEGMEDRYDNFIAPHAGMTTFAKITDRRMMGSMVEYVKTAQIELGPFDETPPAVMRKLARMPMSVIGQKYAIEVFRNIPYMRTVH